MDIHQGRKIIDRPGVAGAVLQTASSFINSVSQSVSQPFPPLASYNRLIPF